MQSIASESLLPKYILNVEFCQEEMLKVHAFIPIPSHRLHDILVEYANQPCLFLSAIF